jgi:hypothetical protein
MKSTIEPERRNSLKIYDLFLHEYQQRRAPQRMVFQFNIYLFKYLNRFLYRDRGTQYLIYDINKGRIRNI